MWSYVEFSDFLMLGMMGVAAMLGVSEVPYMPVIRMVLAQFEPFSKFGTLRVLAIM